jgi:hypothetical protein
MPGSNIIRGADYSEIVRVFLHSLQGNNGVHYDPFCSLQLDLLTDSAFK